MPIDSQNPMLVIEDREEDEVDGPEVTGQVRSRSVI
jgi:hypothetical protein